MTPALESAISKLREKALSRGEAQAYEQELEDDRAAIKADAIVRIMKRDGIAATRAEAIVETDADYFNHRASQRLSIVARFKADAEYWAAKVECTQASLITPDVFALESEMGELCIANQALSHELTKALNQRNEARDTVKLLQDAFADSQRALENSVEPIP